MRNLAHESVKTKLESYQSEVVLKYQIYNGLFLGLPFADSDQAGARLPIFSKMCEDWLKEGKTPPEAVVRYLEVVPIPEERKPGLLIKFLQFVERQVVLFDALEDAAFSKINDMSGFGTIDYMLQKVNNEQLKYHKHLQSLLKNYKTRLVLTAHPTQFYPNVILAIIVQLGKAIENNDLDKVRDLFLQMGLTRFANKAKPTPIDEALSIIWYLEHVFYNVVPRVQSKLSSEMVNLDIGFWPGGDRDGNPYVTADVTIEVADRLRNSLMRLYYRDIQDLRLRLTFDGPYDDLGKIALKIKKDQYRNYSELISDLNSVMVELKEKYQGLFSDLVRDVILKINIFKFHFAKIDIRQNSAIHRNVVHEILSASGVNHDYKSLAGNEKLDLLVANWNINLNSANLTDEMANEVLNTIRAIAKVQKLNGKQAIERYIISNTDSVASVVEVLWLVNLINQELDSESKILIEIVPLFETVDDLDNSYSIMEQLYNLPVYASNLKALSNQQTIMLGFSDGTKDGGYLMANWAIFLAKKKLSLLASKYSVNVTFFDGRGGPPSRGGGNTYAFYQSLAQEIEAHEIQLTIQGQTISANFGTHDSAIFNMEHLLSAGISGQLFTTESSIIEKDEEELINQMAEYSLEYYLQLKNDPIFLDYLQEITPLNYLAAANIGSRPAKRNKGSELKLEDLRAIPFGGAWMQMKQNILGYYGVGSAIQKLLSQDRMAMHKLQHLYQHSLFFKGLVDNSMQSLATTNFEITKHLRDDPKFGAFWQKLYDEAELTKELLLYISGHDSLIADNPVKDLSTEFREQIILPLLLIQQYAMDKLRKMDSNDKSYETYEHLVKKSLAASINASRNSI